MPLTDLQKSFLKNDLISKDNIVDPATGGLLDWGSVGGSTVEGIEDVPGLQTALDALQPLDSDLTAIAALSTTAYGRSLLALADASAARTLIDAAQSSHSHGAVSPHAIEPTTLDATYGDHFTGSSLNAKWTRRGRPANEDLYSSPSILIPSPVNGANFGDTQAFSDADEFDILLAASHYSLADEGFGIICVNSSGTGLWTGYRNTNRLGIFSVTTWATSLEPVSNNGLAGSSLYGTGEKRWWRLMKRKTALAGDLYAAAFSMDGMRWTHGTGWYDPTDFTPAHIGWWLGVQNASANRPLAIDLFDAKRRSLGPNLLRFPTSGTVTPSSDASSQGGTIGNVINGSAGDEWYFANSNAAGVSLTLTFSVAQTLNRLRFRGRTDQFGDALIEFSDGSQYPVGLYTGSTSWVVWDVPATKTTTYIKIIWQKSQHGSNPGFSEIEAYLATAA